MTKPETQRTKTTQDPVPGCCDQARGEAKRNKETSEASSNSDGRCCGASDKRANPRRRSSTSRLAK